MRRPTESEIEKKVTAYAASRGWLPIKLNGPGDRGKPDRLYLDDRGGVLFVEFKKPGGKVRVLQQWFINRLIAREFRVHVIDNVEAGCALFD